MNLLKIIVFFGAAALAFIEQDKEKPNLIIMIACMAIFIYGLYSLMKKIPSKDETHDEQ